MQKTAIRLASILAGLALVIGVYGSRDEAHSPSWQKHISKLHEQVSGEGETGGRRIPGQWYFYLQRTAGNPGVNVDKMTFEAAREVEMLKRTAFRKTAQAPVWQALGPANIAGRMRAIAFHPTDPDILYAGAASGGVFKLTDANGARKNWIPVMDFVPALPVGALALDPNDPETVFAGTGEPVAQTPLSFSSPTYYGVGVMKSTNGGDSWELLPWINSRVAVQRIIVSPVSPDTLLVATTSGLYKTKNNGERWTRVITGNTTDLKAKPGSPHILYAAVGEDEGSAANGVYRSELNGHDTSWVKLDDGWPDGYDLGRILLATTPADPDLLMAFLSKPMSGPSPVSDDFYGIMKSTDGGETWEELNPIGITATNFGRGQLFYDFCVAISPEDPDLIYAGGFELWRSSDGGNFWTLSARGNQVHVDHHVLAFQPGTNHIWNGNDGGIYVNEGSFNTWQNVEQNLETVQYYTLEIDPVYPWRLYGGTQDNGTHRLNVKDQKLWDGNINGGDGGYVAIARENSNIFFTNITAVQESVYRTTNGGGSHRKIVIAEDHFFNWIKPMALVYPSSDNTAQLYVGGQKMFIVEDATNPTFHPSSQLLSDDELVRGGKYESVTSTIAVSPSNPDYMYVGSGDAGLFRSRNLQDGPDNVRFEEITNPLAGPNWVTRVAVDPRNEHIVYATYSGYRSLGHVWRSANDGTHWENISSNLPDIPVNSIKVHPVYSNVLFIATDAGVWITTNTGEHWEPLGIGHPNVVVSDIDFTTADEDLYLVSASYGRGMWTLKLPDYAVGADEVAQPGGLQLAQSYPNPVAAGGTALISFTTPAAKNVTVKLYDVQGREVRTLFDAASRIGGNAVRFGTEGLPPGMYFYRLQAGKEIRTKKLVIE